MFHTKDGIVVHERADWKARGPKSAYAKQPPLFAFVYHHGGEKNPPLIKDSDVAELLRRWQAFHMDAPDHLWADIGYHAIVDGRGHIWLGRPYWAVGAHVLAQNTGRIGYCFPQDGTKYGLNDAQEETVRKLFRVRHDKLGLPALKAWARNPNFLHGVFGHREIPGQSTACPGDALAADFKRIIREYAK